MIDVPMEPPSEPCTSCDGTGEIRVLRDKHGNIDYIDGVFDGENLRCQRCQGEGYI